jgi:hypothetical protein
MVPFLRGTVAWAKWVGQVDITTWHWLRGIPRDNFRCGMCIGGGETIGWTEADALRFGVPYGCIVYNREFYLLLPDPTSPCGKVLVKFRHNIVAVHDEFDHGFLPNPKRVILVPLRKVVARKRKRSESKRRKCIPRGGFVLKLTIEMGGKP